MACMPPRTMGVIRFRWGNLLERRNPGEAGAVRQRRMVSSFAETKDSTVRAKPEQAALKMRLLPRDSGIASRQLNPLPNGLPSGPTAVYTRRL